MSDHGSSNPAQPPQRQQQQQRSKLSASAPSFVPTSTPRPFYDNFTPPPSSPAPHFLPHPPVYPPQFIVSQESILPIVIRLIPLISSSLALCSSSPALSSTDDDALSSAGLPSHASSRRRPAASPLSSSASTSQPESQSSPPSPSPPHQEKTKRTNTR